jgi:NAD(P)-dependent dehydrogenase (short-subunit alcohol dehydrogenase family)
MRPFSNRVETEPEISSTTKSGADQGLGYLTAEALIKQGFLVFVGCLTPQAVAQWQGRKLKNVRAFKLDVTKLEEIAAAAELVAKESPQGL